MKAIDLPIGGPVCPVKRSQLLPIWQSAPKELIIDNLKIAAIAYSDLTHPRHLNPKYTWIKRFNHCNAMSALVIDDIPIPPEPIESREYWVPEKFDPRYKSPQITYRSILQPHWRNARTSLIKAHVRTIMWAIGFEEYTSPDISWKAHEARAFQYPVTVIDDTASAHIQDNANNEYWACLSKKEQKQHLKFRQAILGKVVEEKRKEWSN